MSSSNITSATLAASSLNEIAATHQQTAQNSIYAAEQLRQGSPTDTPLLSDIAKLIDKLAKAGSIDSSASWAKLINETYGPRAVYDENQTGGTYHPGYELPRYLSLYNTIDVTVSNQSKAIISSLSKADQLKLQKLCNLIDKKADLANQIQGKIKEIETIMLKYNGATELHVKPLVDELDKLIATNATVASELQKEFYKVQHNVHQFSIVAPLTPPSILNARIVGRQV